MTFFREMISDEKGQPSSSRFQMLGGWLVLSIIILWYTWPREVPEFMLYTYAAFSAGVYGWAIKNNRDIRVEDIKANAQPAIVQNADNVNVDTKPKVD